MFLWTASAKALAPSDFQDFVASFIPGKTIYAALWGTIALEFILGSALLFRRWRSISLKVTIALLALFSVLLAFAAARGIEESCGCGLGAVTPSAAILRNLVIVVLAGAALVVHWREPFLKGETSCTSVG